MSDPWVPVELIGAWLDGQLTGQENARAEALIAENPQYAELVRQWKTQREKIRLLPKYRLDAEFSDRVLARFNELATDSIPSAGTFQRSAETTNYARSAAAAILSLAAMLLLILFVFPSPFDDFGLLSMKVPDSEIMERFQPDESNGEDVGAKLANEPVGDFAPIPTAETMVEEQIQSKTGVAEFKDRLSPGRVENEPTARRAIEKLSPLAKEKNITRLGKGFAGGANSRKSDVGKSTAGGMGGGAEEMAAQQGFDMGRALAKKLENADAAGLKILQSKKSIQPTDPSSGIPMPGAPPVVLSIEAAENRQEVANAIDSNEDAITVDTDNGVDDNAVSEVWVIDFNERPSLEKLELAMQQNQIPFQQSLITSRLAGGRGRFLESDSKVQAVYVMTSPAQMRGAISMLSENAQVTAFRTSDLSPEFSNRATKNNPLGTDKDELLDNRKLVPGAADSPYQSRISYAQQLPSNLQLTEELDEDTRIQSLNDGIDSLEKPDLPLARSDSSRGRRIAETEGAETEGAETEGAETEEANPGETEDEKPFGNEKPPIDGRKEWYQIEAQKTELEAVTAKSSGDNKQLNARPQKLHRYLLLFRFESNLKSQTAPPMPLPSRPPR